MPDFEVREVDVDDEAQLHAWWRASHDGATAGRPYDLYATWELARVAYPDRHPDWDFALISVHDDDRVVGAGMVNMPLADNLSNAYLEVYVPDGERRRGVGTALDLGTARLVGAALAPDGALAGYHDLYVDQHRRTQARVGITMVLPEHRGHSLGLGIKLATHRSLVAQVPECRIVATGNADVNAHMNAVNERMGYRLVEQLLEFQKKA